MGRLISDKIRRGRAVSLSVNGSTVTAYEGETLAAVLLAEEVVVFNRTASGEPRAPYCNMGTCFECQVKVAEPGSAAFRWMRACVTPAADGMTIRTGERLSAPERDHHGNGNNGGNSGGD